MRPDVHCRRRSPEHIGDPGRELRVAISRVVERGDRGFAGLGVQIARDHHDRVGVGVLLGERDHLTRLAGVQHVVGLARRGTRRRVAWSIVAAAREMRRKEVDDAGGARSADPQRRAERTGETEAA